MEELERDLARTRESARDDRELIRAILRSMFEGVLVIAPDGKVLFSNDVFARMFGCEDGRGGERDYWELFRHEKLHGLIDKALKTHEGVRGELEVLFPEERHHQVQISPIRGKDSFLGIVLVLHDVTHLKRLERMRSEFVANVSHELKTPLASILAAVETLQGGAVDDLEHRDTFLRMIDEHAGRLKVLIDDLLLIARLETPGFEIEKEEVPVAELWKEVERLHGPRAREKGLRLLVGDAGGAGTVRCNREKVRQALSNLVDNAVKYTDAGGEVRLEARREGGDVVFSVRDSGIGISEEEQKRIFERFYRTEKSRSRDAGGTGLGLSIVKHIAEAHRGSVSVESRPHEGSTFTLRIPGS
jgi:two-component system phosphate regulon sensor histidine kinase PhoR